MINFSDIRNLQEHEEMQAFATLFVDTFTKIEPIKQGINIVLGCDNFVFEGVQAAINDLYKLTFSVSGVPYYEIEFHNMYSKEANIKVNSKGSDLENVYKDMVFYAANRISIEIEQREYYRNLHTHN